MQTDHPELRAKQQSPRPFPYLCNHSTGSSTLVSPGWGEDSNGLIVPGETVNSGLDKNETELGVLVLSVALKMLANSDGL